MNFDRQLDVIDKTLLSMAIATAQGAGAADDDVVLRLTDADDRITIMSWTLKEAREWFNAS